MDSAKLLQAYQPVDPREQTFLARLQSLTTHPDSHSRHHYQPGHFTASAFVVSQDGQSVALIFHPKFSRWLQPGGHIEPTDPDLLAAARREVEEELGIHELSPLGGLFDVDIHDIPARSKPPAEPAHQHFDLRFCFQTSQTIFSGELEARWVRLVDVASLETDESVMRAVRKLQQSPILNARL